MAVAYKSEWGAAPRCNATQGHEGRAAQEGATGALAPLLEGARARGVADALELAGQAAILLGGAGDVLHAGASAKPLLGEGLRVANGRLVSRNGHCAAFDSLLETALEGVEPCQERGIILPIPGGGAMRVRILPFDGGKSNPAQLLKALVLLDRINLQRPPCAECP